MSIAHIFVMCAIFGVLIMVAIWAVGEIDK